ncbi:hypothetical protein RFI_20941, partial [Reticulomyxa filosa]
IVPPLMTKEEVQRVEAQQLIDSIMNHAERLHEYHQQYRILFVFIFFFFENKKNLTYDKRNTYMNLSQAAKEKLAVDYQMAAYSDPRMTLEMKEKTDQVHKQMNEIIRNMHNHYYKIVEELNAVLKFPLNPTQQRHVQSYQMYCDDFGKTQAHLIQGFSFHSFIHSFIHSF